MNIITDTANNPYFKKVQRKEGEAQGDWLSRVKVEVAYNGEAYGKFWQGLLKTKAPEMPEKEIAQRAVAYAMGNTYLALDRETDRDQVLAVGIQFYACLLVLGKVLNKEAPKNIQDLFRVGREYQRTEDVDCKKELASKLPDDSARAIFLNLTKEVGEKFMHTVLQMINRCGPGEDYRFLGVGYDVAKKIYEADEVRQKLLFKEAWGDWLDGKVEFCGVQ